MEISRRKVGRGFSYLDEAGQKLDACSQTDKQTLDWIKSLAIPPAWEEVIIDARPDAKIIACGRDEGGKKQYIYGEKWLSRRTQLKFERMHNFARQLDNMRKVTRRHLREFGDRDNGWKPGRNAVLACMVRLIDSAYFRPGNERYYKENESFGITTLRSKHLNDSNDELEFNYKGKSGVEQTKTVADPKLVKIVQELDEEPGYRIFKYYDDNNKKYVTSGDLNLYIAEIMGSDYSAKDFRTRAGTLIVAESLDEQAHKRSNKNPRKNVITALEVAAAKLGNSPTVCEQNYVDPRVIKAWEDGSVIGDFRQRKSDSELSANESATLVLLEEFS
jgi:DNA topoisomerase-1